jgi:hypothetical protein
MWLPGRFEGGDKAPALEEDVAAPRAGLSVRQGVHIDPAAAIDRNLLANRTLAFLVGPYLPRTRLGKRLLGRGLLLRASSSKRLRLGGRGASYRRRTHVWRLRAGAGRYEHRLRVPQEHRATSRGRQRQTGLPGPCSHRWLGRLWVLGSTRPGLQRLGHLRRRASLLRSLREQADHHLPQHRLYPRVALQQRPDVGAPHLPGAVLILTRIEGRWILAHHQPIGRHSQRIQIIRRAGGG